jgi:hypothetical protein
MYIYGLVSVSACLLPNPDLLAAWENTACIASYQLLLIVVYISTPIIDFSII